MNTEKAGIQWAHTHTELGDFQHSCYPHMKKLSKQPTKNCLTSKFTRISQYTLMNTYLTKKFLASQFTRISQNPRTQWAPPHTYTNLDIHTKHSCYSKLRTTPISPKKMPSIGLHSKFCKWKCKNQMSHIHIHIQCSTCEGTHTELELKILRELDLREWGVYWNCLLRVLQEKILVWLRGVVAAQQARGGVAMAAIATKLLELLQQSRSSHTHCLPLCYPFLLWNLWTA